MISINSQLNKPKSALVAMSGGIDSTAAALLMQRAGVDCAGAVMKVFEGGDKTVYEAKAVASQLNIPFYEFDFIGQFNEQVIDPFIKDYQNGRTPNPCVVCNRQLKFGIFLDKAMEMGKDCIVTGHYAKIEPSSCVPCVPREPSPCVPCVRYILKKSIDLAKDQSYVLYSLTQEQLARICFPLGKLTKTEAREIAAQAGFDNANKSESQDICFIPDGDYMRFINDYTSKPQKPGRFVDINGKILGESKAISSYTIGQRRGLGLSMPHPPYVIEIKPDDNIVVIGKEEMLYSRTLIAKNINLIPCDSLTTPIKAQVKIRYSDPGHTATVRQTDEDTLHIEFDEPQRAITKGQAAVIYEDDIVIGGGTIT